MIFSIVAIYKESWFRAAYISVEISYAANTTIFIIFWLVLWPAMTQQIDAILAKATPEDKEKMAGTITFLKWYQGLLHFIPLVSTVINLGITDMTLNKRHWWIAVLTLCPGYMIANLWGSMTLG